MNQEPTPSYEAVAEARRSPNAWIYQVDGKYSGNETVPPEAIAGAWRVDHTGKIVGSFIRNPNYAKTANAGDTGMPVQSPWGNG